MHFLSITECTERTIKRNANKLFFLGGGTLTRKLYANMNHRHLTSHYQLCFAKFAKTLQSCLTLCNPIDGSPPGSPIPGILQARTLEWVATSFSDASKWKVKVKSLSRARLVVTPWTAAYQAPPSMGFSRQEYWSGVPSPSPTNHVKPLLIHVDDRLACFSNFTCIHRTLYQVERKQSQQPAAEAGTTHMAASDS